MSAQVFRGCDGLPHGCRKQDKGRRMASTSPCSFVRGLSQQRVTQLTGESDTGAAAVLCCHLVQPISVLGERGETWLVWQAAGNGECRARG